MIRRCAGGDPRRGFQGSRLIYATAAGENLTGPHTLRAGLARGRYAAQAKATSTLLVALRDHIDRNRSRRSPNHIFELCPLAINSVFRNVSLF
jgi:hypothetical protein